MDPTILHPAIILAACMVSACIGFITACLIARGSAQRAERRAWRESEALHRARALQDLRDNTSARIPHA